jgi:dCMP deaminase
MKEKFISAFMDVASRFAELSSAKRLKVGAIVVKDDRIVSIGYNGMPSGWDNNCEETQWTYDIRDTYFDDWKYCENKKQYYRFKTKPQVIHAEANAIAKLAKSTESGQDATMFLTHAPCIDCAKQIYTAGIKKVYFGQAYRDNQGVAFLQQCGVEVDKYPK